MVETPLDQRHLYGFREIFPFSLPLVHILPPRRENKSHDFVYLSFQDITTSNIQLHPTHVSYFRDKTSIVL
jgi:hypothetical protein